MWRGHSVEGYYDTRWLKGLWSTKAKVEGVVVKAARRWGSNSNIVNDPLVEPELTPLFVGLPSTWGPVDGDLRFFPVHRSAPLGTPTDINE